MASSRRKKGRLRAIFSAVMVLAFFALVAAPTAQAFEIFGFRLWGSDLESNADLVVDPVHYDVALAFSVPNDDLRDDLKNASLLVTKKDILPSGTVGLIQRARDDQANLIGRLYEDGYFGAVVNIVIEGRQLENISVTDPLGNRGRNVAVAISVNPGPSFTFGKIRIIGGRGAKADEAVSKAGLIRGAPASSKVITAAADALVKSWQREGHPFAVIASQDVIADHANNTVIVTLGVTPGSFATIGAVTVMGTERLDPAFVERQAEVPVGAPYHPDIIEHTRKNLGRIEALGSIIVRTGNSVDASGAVPLIIEVSERELRTIGVGAYYSSIDGVGGEAFWLHRNLFGEGEKLRLEAEIGRDITTSSYNDLDSYNGRLGFHFEKPGIHGPRVDWLVSGAILQEDPDPYFRRGVVFATDLRYRWDNELTLTGGIAYDWSRIDDAFGRNKYSLLSAPIVATYDSRDNALDATTGIYARLLGEPDYGTDSGSLFFTGDSELRLYHTLDDDAHFVLAARGRVGSIIATDLEDMPAHRRFYAGGGGSVRGYDYLGIGPKIPGLGATGGLSRLEGSIEARIKITDTIGIVPFADAAYVAETSLFGGDEEFRTSIGLGLRYYTVVGPLRLDVALPLDPHSGDPGFGVYFGIGQSF